MKKLLVLAVLLMVFVASPVMAKEGFYLGAFIPNNTISGDAGAGTSSGSGWGLRVGNGLNRYLAIEGNYSTTSHDSVDLKGLAVDLKLNFPLTTLDSAQVMSLEPYILIGYTHYEIGDSTTFKSDGLQYGIGIELYLFKELSVNVGLTKSAVSFDTSPKLDGTVKTLDIGLIYHFI